jgi:hypothetical protein
LPIVVSYGKPQYPLISRVAPFASLARHVQSLDPADRCGALRQNECLELDENVLGGVGGLASKAPAQFRETKREIYAVKLATPFAIAIKPSH